jgi:hypothetical protein
MTRTFHFSLLLTITVFSACQKDLPTATEAAFQEVSNARTGASDISLSVSVDDAADNLMRSDGKGAYVNKSNNVQAVIWGAGDFFMNTNINANRDPARKVLFDQVLGYPDFNAVKNYSFRTEGLNLQTMTVGAVSVAGFRIWGEYPTGTYKWKLQFRQGSAGSDLLTDQVYVQRTASDTWIIWPCNEANSKLVDGSGNLIQYFKVPLRLTLKKIK